MFALTALMTLSLVACGSKDESKGGDSTSDVTYKTSFTYAIGGSPAYLDPAIASDSIGSYVLNQTTYPLFQLTQKGVL